MIANETITFATDLEKEFQPKTSLGYLISHALKALSSRLVDNFAAAGHSISRQQWLILAKAYHIPNSCLLQSSVVDMMMGDKTAVTRGVEDLVKRGLLIQEIDEKDRRNRVLQLTDKGQELMPELMQIVKETIADLTVDISESDLDIAKNVLNIIIENGNKPNQ